MHISNGSGLFIQNISYSHFRSKYDSTRQLNLNNLLHVPHITKNLLSVFKFAKDNDIFFKFHPHYCFLKDLNTKDIFLEGTTKGCHYVPNLGLKDGKTNHAKTSITNLSSSSLTTNKTIQVDYVHCNELPLMNRKAKCLEPFAFTSCIVVDAKIWHLRLGHSSFKIVQTILNRCNLPISNMQELDFLCQACQHGKSHEFPFDVVKH